MARNTRQLHCLPFVSLNTQMCKFVGTKFEFFRVKVAQRGREEPRNKKRDFFTHFLTHKSKLLSKIFPTFGFHHQACSLANYPLEICWSIIPFSLRYDNVIILGESEKIVSYYKLRALKLPLPSPHLSCILSISWILAKINCCMRFYCPPGNYNFIAGNRKCIQHAMLWDRIRSRTIAVNSP